MKAKRTALPIGVLVIVVVGLFLLGATQGGERRFQGFPLTNGDWVVVDTDSGASCRYLARGLTDEEDARIESVANTVDSTAVFDVYTTLFFGMRNDCRPAW